MQIYDNTLHCIVHVFLPVWNCTHASVFKCISVENIHFRNVSLYVVRLSFYIWSSSGFGELLPFENGDSFQLKFVILSPFSNGNGFSNRRRSQFEKIAAQYAFVNVLHCHYFIEWAWDSERTVPNAQCTNMSLCWMNKIHIIHRNFVDWIILRNSYFGSS